MKTLEEITYEAGRDALADQESIVSGIRQRTGTLLAAQAIVASFLGAAALREDGAGAWEWGAIAALLLGLLLAAVVLSPWRLRFSVDARALYEALYPEAAAEAADGTLGWLAAAGYAYQAMRASNTRRVQSMSRCQPP